jgi:putative transposase
MIHKSHNVSVLLYHAVFPAKYRRVVIDEAVDGVLRDVALEISKRYEMWFLEIGTDGDHVHFLVQSVPTYSPTRILTTIKSLTAREVFKRCPQVKKQLWGGEFWTDGYFVSTVGPQGNEETIADYVRNQGKEQGKDLRYTQLYREPPTATPPPSDQLTLF